MYCQFRAVAVAPSPVFALTLLEDVSQLDIEDYSVASGKLPRTVRERRRNCLSSEGPFLGSNDLRRPPARLSHTSSVRRYLRQLVQSR